MFPLHVLLGDVQPEHLGDEELLPDNLGGQVFQHLECLIHAGAPPPHLGAADAAACFQEVQEGVLPGLGW